MKLITIGRTPDNNVVINNPQVSRRHAQLLQRDNGTVTISDMRSRNGTFVNGKRIYGETRLRAGYRVKIGNVDFAWQNYVSNGNTGGRRSENNMGWIVGGVVGGVLLLAFIIGLVLYFVNLTPDQSDNDWGTSNNGVRTKVPDVRDDNTVSFNGTKIRRGAGIDELKRLNPEGRFEKKRNKGYSNEISSVEPYDYYIFYNVYNERTMVIDEVNTTIILDKTYKTETNINIGCSWGEVAKAYPRAEFWLLFQWYDYFSYRYEQCIYIYDPATCTGFIFKGSLFSETQRQGIYAAVGGSDFDKQFFASAISSSVYSSICASATVYQIVLGNCGNKNRETQQPETYNMKDIDANTTEVTTPSGNTTRYTKNELVGTKWVYQGNCFSNNRYEVLEIQDNGKVKLTINGEAPWYGEYIYTDNRKEMSFLYYLAEHSGTRFYVYNNAIYFSDKDWSDPMFETCDHQHKIFKRINSDSHKSEDKVKLIFSIPFDYTNYKNNRGGTLSLPNGKELQYDFYVSTVFGSTAFDQLYFYSTGNENPNLIYQYNITLIRPSGSQYYGGRETNWLKGVETQYFDTKEWKDNQWNIITVEVTR